MKAFSKIPDPFGEGLESVHFYVPFKKINLVESIPQGNMFHNVNHMINSSNQQKHAALSLDIGPQESTTIQKKIQNTENPQQRLNLQEIKNHQKQYKAVKQVKKSQQNVIQIPIESDFKLGISHIIFSKLSQETAINMLRRKQIFSKDLAKKNYQKDQIKQKTIQITQEQKILKQTKSFQVLEVKENHQVEEHIECSFFGNKISRKSMDRQKQTGFKLNDCTANDIKILLRPKSISQISRLQKKGTQKRKGLSMVFENRKFKFKKQGGRKLFESKLQESFKLTKRLIQYTKSVSTSPVFF